MRTSATARRAERGFSLLELMIAVGLSAGLFLGVASILRDSSRAERQQAQSYALRTQTSAALRRMARELEQSSMSSPSFSTSGGITFNLPTAVGTTTTWGPPITYRVNNQGVLVREEGSSVVRVMGSCVALQAVPSGRRVNLRLTAEASPELEANGSVRRPRFQEQLDVVLLR